MGDENSLINFGDLSKPATTLIEKISDAVGGYFRPHQIKRVAKAEAEAKKIKKKADLEITELEQRAVQRFIAEEAKKQENIESITSKALPDLDEDADPNQIEDDWITNFFDKCRLISDDEMQELWSKVLTGEANSPNSYSKRTVNFLSSLDKKDAELFQSLCGFGWYIGRVTPLIFDESDDIYKNNDINFNTLKHLDDIGLISFSSISGYQKLHLPKKVHISYYGTPIILEFPKEEDNSLPEGKVLLSKTGEELAPICGSTPVDEFLEYTLDKWIDQNIIPSSPIESST